MNIARIIERLRNGDRRSGTNVGHALPGDIVKLGQLRAAACGIELPDRYTEGYRDAMLDIVAGYCAEWNGRAERWPKHWREVYEALRTPSTPTEVAGFLAIDISQASRVLSAMFDSGLLAKEPALDGRSKRYLRRSPTGENQ